MRSGAYLPQRAFTDAAAAWDEEHRKGAELDGCTAVLFLEPATERGFEPVGWGSGVKWVVGDRVFGHAQPINPGDHVLVPDAEADSLDGLRGRLAGILGDPDPEVADLAHSCLEEIVGDDLGERPEPWFKWLAGLAAPAGK